MRKTYQHRADLSTGPLTDLVTLPNVPMFGMLAKMRSTGPDQLLASNYFLDSMDQKVFETRTVRKLCKYEHFRCTTTK